MTAPSGRWRKMIEPSTASIDGSLRSGARAVAMIGGPAWNIGTGSPSAAAISPAQAPAALTTLPQVMSMPRSVVTRRPDGGRLDAGGTHALDHLGAMPPGGASHRRSGAGGIGDAVARRPGGAGHQRRKARPAPPRLAAVEHLDRDTMRVGLRRIALEPRMILGAECQIGMAAAVVAATFAGERLEALPQLVRHERHRVLDRVAAL